MARTYLEKNMTSFATCSRDELIRHGLRALKESLVQDRQLTVENTSVGVVGGDKKKPDSFAVFDGQDVKAWIDSVADDKEGGGDDDEAEASASAAPMEVDS